MSRSKPNLSSDRVHRCLTCGRSFCDKRSLQQHLNATNHGLCFCDCGKSFLSKQAMEIHRETSKVHNSFDCDYCGKKFSTERSLQQHMCSLASHALRDLRCPKCSHLFKNAGGLALHFESGACLRVSQAVFFAAVRSMEHYIGRPNLVTNASVSLIGVRDQLLLCPAEASESAWNGECFECYLCNQGFRSLKQLNMHLSSHQSSKLYHCPKCTHQFQTMSAFVQHVESEVCGFLSFRKMKSKAKDVLEITESFSRLLEL